MKKQKNTTDKTFKKYLLWLSANFPNLRCYEQKKADVKAGSVSCYLTKLPPETKCDDMASLLCLGLGDFTKKNDGFKLTVELKATSDTLLLFSLFRAEQSSTCTYLDDHPLHFTRNSNFP